MGVRIGHHVWHGIAWIGAKQLAFRRRVLLWSTQDGEGRWSWQEQSSDTWVLCLEMGRKSSKVLDFILLFFKQFSKLFVHSILLFIEVSSLHTPPNHSCAFVGVDVFCL
jgi:hypothetical protein